VYFRSGILFAEDSLVRLRNILTSWSLFVDRVFYILSVYVVRPEW